MSFMKGDLLTKTRALVKGMAKREPVWLQAMEKAPPPTFPRAKAKVERITLPEDVYIKKFYKSHPKSLPEDPNMLCNFDFPPSRIFAWRVLELKEQGINEAEAVAVAEMEYRQEKKAKKEAYKKLKEIARLQGKKPPPKPYPSAVKQVQAEENKYALDGSTTPKIRDIVDSMFNDIAKGQNQGLRGGGGW